MLERLNRGQGKEAAFIMDETSAWRADESEGQPTAFGKSSIDIEGRLKFRNELHGH
jgi:hypothetical protein